MAIFDDIRRVLHRTNDIYERRRAAVYALSLQYAALALNYFRQQQAQSRYWQNQTGLARDLMFSDAFMEGQIIGWFMAHGVEYGPYLELANDGKNQAIRPVIQRYAGRFFRDVRSLYGDE